MHLGSVPKSHGRDSRARWSNNAKGHGAEVQPFLSRLALFIVSLRGQHAFANSTLTIH